MIRPVEHDAVEQAIQEYLIERTDADAIVQNLAARHHLLPLLIDWTGFIGLSPSGVILWVEYDPPHKVEDAEKAEAGRWRAGIRHLAFAAGHRRYPELRWLAP